MAAVGRGLGTGGRRFALLTVAPATIILIALSIFPLVYSLRLSFTDEALLSVQPTHFIGLTNYWNLLHDSLFWSSLWVTLAFAASVVTLQLGVGLALALALRRLPRYQQLTVTLLLIPSIISPSVASFQWRQLFDFNGGVLNYFLGLIGIAPQTWTASPTAALPSLLLVDFWEWTPFMVLLLFAGLSALPESVFEAARIDGSSSVQILIYQTLPLLRRVIAIAVILRLIAAFKIFDIIYALTAGGPGTSTESLNYYIYVQGFRYFTMGYSAALSFVTLILIVVLAKLILGFMERPVGEVKATEPAAGIEAAAGMV
jgi:multiple sugar transport system permease protein